VYLICNCYCDDYPKNYEINETPVIKNYSDYSFYSAVKLVKGFGYFNLVYYIDNESWLLPGNFNDIIHFNVSNPETGAFVEGDYTPDLSIYNNTFYFDILVVNWNDTAQKEFCSQVSDYSSAYLYSYEDTGYDWESYFRSLEAVSINKYNKSLGIGEYDEIRVNVPAFGYFGIPGEDVDYPEDIENQYIIFEKNCNSSFCIGNISSQTSVAFKVEIA
jgi:hypothetical protein